MRYWPALCMVCARFMVPNVSNADLIPHIQAPFGVHRQAVVAPRAVLDTRGHEQPFVFLNVALTHYVGLTAQTGRNRTIAWSWENRQRVITLTYHVNAIAVQRALLRCMINTVRSASGNMCVDYSAPPSTQPISTI